MNNDTTIKTAIILEIPHQRPASAYRVHDMAHLHECANAASGESTPYEKITVRELLGIYGDAEDIAEEIKDGNEFVIKIIAIGEKYGMDALLYRADWLGTYGEYTATEIDEEEALLAAIGHDLHDMLTFTSEADAREAMEWGRITRTGHQEDAARAALHELLNA